MKLTPKNRELREMLYSSFIAEFFGIRGLPKVYQADDVYYFYTVFCKKHGAGSILLSRPVFLKKLRADETIDHRTESRLVCYFSVGNDECPVFYREKKPEPVILDKKIVEFAEKVKNERAETYMPRSELYAMYRNTVSDPLGRNAFYAEMRKISPEGHGKTRYFNIKKTKIIEK